MGPIKPFVARTLLWLPVCFAAWYFFSIVLTAPLAWVVGQIMTWALPSVIDGIAQEANGLIVMTHLAAPPATTGGPSAGEVLFELNALKYGYCVPLYTALVLASPGEDGVRLLRWLLGMLILALVQVFGITTEILKVLAFQLGDQAREALAFPAPGYDAIALAYQLGYLILPPVVPIVIWFGQFQHTLTDLFGKSIPRPPGSGS